MIESSSLSRTLPASHDPALVRPVFFTLKHEIQAACGSSPTLHVAWLRTPGPPRISFRNRMVSKMLVL